MMEAKFRVWDKKEKRFIKSMPCRFLLDIHTGHIYDTVEEQYYSERYLLMQYIGLKDKNREEIYFGDIISVIWSVLDRQDSFGNETYVPVTSRFKVEQGNSPQHWLNLIPLSDSNDDSPYSVDEYSWILDADVNEDDIEIIGNKYEILEPTK